MNATEKIEFKCPFFVNSIGLMLTCESLIGNTAMITKFNSKTDLRHHMKEFCAREDGGKCPLALNLYEKYERLERLSRLRAQNRHFYGLKED